MGINPKSEYRNSKQIQNPNLQMFKTDTTKGISKSLGFGHCDFDHSDLFRASYFEFDVHPVL